MTKEIGLTKVQKQRRGCCLGFFVSVGHVLLFKVFWYNDFMKIENVGPKRKIPPEIPPKILEEEELKTNKSLKEQSTIEDFDNQSTVDISNEAIEMLKRKKNV